MQEPVFLVDQLTFAHVANFRRIRPKEAKIAALNPTMHRSLFTLLLTFTLSGCSQNESDAPARSEPTPTATASARSEESPAPTSSADPLAPPGPGPAPAPDTNDDPKRPGPPVTKKDLPPTLSSPKERSANTTVTDALSEYGFPVHESLKHLCGDRVLQPDGKLYWDAFYSPRTPSELAASYEKRLGKSGRSSAPGGGARWRLRERTLTITKPSAPGRHKICIDELKQAKGAKSVVVASRAL